MNTDKNEEAPRTQHYPGILWVALGLVAVVALGLSLGNARRVNQLVLQAQAAFGAPHLEKRSLSVADETGQVRLTASSLGPQGETGLFLMDEQGQIRMSMFVDAQGLPLWRLHEEDGTVRFEIGLTEEGEPYATKEALELTPTTALTDVEEGSNEAGS